MAGRFASPVSDEQESSLRASARADKQFQVSMALLSSVAKKNSEKFKAIPPCDSKENFDEDFQPMRKKNGNLSLMMCKQCSRNPA